MASLKFDPKRLDFLDVARGSAALLILLEHGFQHCFPEYVQFSVTNIVIGQAGILVFFMISGFVIPKSLESGQSNATFWQRRFFRLFPVYWFSIALAFGYLLLGGQTPIGVELGDTKTWLANAGLLQRVLNTPNIWGVYWSLHYEVALYIVCSILFACGLLRRIGPKSLVAILVGYAVGFSALPWLKGSPSGNGDLRLVLLACLFGLMVQRYLAQRMTRATFYGLLAGMFAVTLTVWGANRLSFPEATTVAQLLRWLTILAVATGGFVGLMELRHRPMPRVALWFGRRSYPIYLVHPFVLVLLVPTGWSTGIVLPTAIALSLLLAELTHRLVEKPGIALGRYLEQRPKRTVEPTAEPLPIRRAA